MLLIRDVPTMPDQPVADAAWTDRAARSRTAQQTWAAVLIRQRLAIFRQYAALVAHRADDLASHVSLPQRTREETFASELIPLADAAKYLAMEAQRLLKPRWVSTRGRPMCWLGVRVQERREPWGLVLIVGPGNYPLLLPGVQMLQALAAGNSVWLKPGRDGTACALALRMLWVEAGGDPALIDVLPEEVESVANGLHAGVDHVVLTGSSTSGQAVLQLAAETITPATMELSGCDAVFVLESADLELTAKAIEFGLVFNGSATCMAPRRIFGSAERLADLLNILRRRSSEWIAKPVATAGDHLARQLIQDAVAAGAELAIGTVPVDHAWSPVVLTQVTPQMPIASADLFAPVTSLIAVADADAAIDAARKSPYALAAAVFGKTSEATTYARRVGAGTVVVNDLIAPTADPRVSFPAWNRSGFGVTRGPEGLLQMTRLQVIVEQHSQWRPHLPAGPVSLNLLRGLLNFTHGLTWKQRWQGLRDLLRSRRARK
jgi:acyl-CoA reductase-like NAD-dependent aldehyde dehydrogenase